MLHRSPLGPPHSGLVDLHRTSDPGLRDVDTSLHPGLAWDCALGTQDTGDGGLKVEYDGAEVHALTPVPKPELGNRIRIA
jgi:hypothetical protein